MSRTFISQPTQVFRSEVFDDALVAGPTLQTTSSNLEADLNAMRSQIRRLLWASVTGSWYDDVTAPSGSNSARGLNTINVDLTDLEQKRFLFRKQNLNFVNVATGSNFALLSASLGTTPSNFAVVYHPLLALPFLTGTIVALLSGTEGTYASHSLALVSGSSVLTPKNLVVVRDAWTGLHISDTNGRDIYALLQAESGSLTGDAFNDSNRRTQLSFVVETISNQTSSLMPALTNSIGGKTITYNYVRRIALDDIPEDAYLSNTIFTDVAADVSSSVSLPDITLNRAIDNQVGVVTMDNNITIRVSSSYAWTFTSGTTTLWQLFASDVGNSMTFNATRMGFSGSVPVTFESGVSVATGSTQINLGVTPGVLNTLTGNSLTLKGGTQLRFGDVYGDTSTYLGGVIPFATSTIEWNNFSSNFGNQTTLLGAFQIISQSLSSSLRRTRASAGTTPLLLTANTNVTFPTNLDAPLLSYLGRDFVKDLNVYLNGVLLLPGRSSADPNDVYPGTSPSTGDLRFPMGLTTGTIISVERF